MTRSKVEQHSVDMQQMQAGVFMPVIHCSTGSLKKQLGFLLSDKTETKDKFCILSLFADIPLIEF